jgi:hypothetical protein
MRIGAGLIALMLGLLWLESRYFKVQRAFRAAGWPFGWRRGCRCAAGVW